MSVDEQAFAPLHLDVHLADGHVVLEAQQVRWGLWDILDLALQVPEVSFPLEVRGDAQGFKNHPCNLQRLHVRLGLDALNTYLAQIDWAAVGLTGVCDLQLQADAAGLCLTGLYRANSLLAPFTCRLAVRPVDLQGVEMVLYDVRLFGLWPLPGPLLTMALCQALPRVSWKACAPDVALVHPGAAFVADVLHRAGWPFAELRQVHLTEVRADATGFEVALMACDPAAAQAALQPGCVPMPQPAALALAGMARHAVAETHLLQGQLEKAYEAYHVAAKTSCTDAWINSRLLSLGVAQPAWHASTEQLAQQMLRSPRGSCAVQARLALATLAIQRHDHAVAAQHYATLLQCPDAALTAFDAAAAQMALRHLTGVQAPAPTQAIDAQNPAHAQAQGQKDASASTATAEELHLALLATWLRRVEDEMAVVADKESVHRLLEQAKAHLPPADSFALCMQVTQMAHARGTLPAQDCALQQARQCFAAVADAAAAAQVVKDFLRQTGCPHTPNSLLTLLQDVGLHTELVAALEQSLIATPAAQDGRFDALVRLLCDDMQAVSRAVAWCQRLCRSLPQEDGPWLRHVTLLMAHPEHGEPALVFEAWAALRQGRARAILLEAWSVYLRRQNRHAAALNVLWDACKVVANSPENVPRLAQLSADYRALGAWPQLVSVFSQLIELQEPGRQQNALLRQKADVASECLDDVLGAAADLDRLVAPNGSDRLWQAGLLMDGGDTAQVADRDELLQPLPGSQRLLLAKALAAAGDLRRLQRVLAPLLLHSRTSAAAWALAETTLKTAEAQPLLLTWRQQALAQPNLDAALRPYLALKTYGQLFELDYCVPSQDDLEQHLQSICWGDVDIAHIAFKLTGAQVGGHVWHLRAAHALIDRLRHDDPRRHAALAAQRRLAFTAAQEAQADFCLRQRHSAALAAQGRYHEAEIQWLQYFQSLQHASAANLRAGSLCALGGLARLRGDTDAACAYFEGAIAEENDSAEAHAGLIAVYTAQRDWDRVVAVHLRQAEMTANAAMRAQHLAMAAAIAAAELNDAPQATWLLEQACVATPRDFALLQRLMDHYTAAGDCAKKLVTAERLLALFPRAHFDADFFMGMAQDYRDVDPVRAACLAGQALARQPHNSERQAFCRQLYAAAGDWQSFVRLEQSSVPELRDRTERAQRSAALASVYIEQLDDLSRGVVALQMAHDAAPEELVYVRQLAAAYARSPSTYGQALEQYQRLLRAAPFTPGTLRILARLAGQQGEMDRCYGYYACLLCLVPDDDEAQRFVLACRRARPTLPQGLNVAALQPVVQAKVPPSVQGLLHDIGSAWLETETTPVATPTPHAILQVISRDVQECLATLMTLRRRQDTAQPAMTHLASAGEARDLFLYVQSQDYFDLRTCLGVAFSASAA